MENQRVKFNRKYRLTIQLQDRNGKPTEDVMVIENPIGISFDVKRGIYAEKQTLDINIYNLSTENRDKIFRDLYKIGEFLMVRLEAGYVSLGMSTIFEGFIWSAYSFRQGTNVITQIKGITNLGAHESYVNTTLAAGHTTQDIVDECMKSMPFYDKGAQVFDNKTFSTSTTLLENPISILKKYTDVDVFIDNMRVYILPNNYAVSIGAVGYTIGDNAGLLSTPRRQDATLTIEMIFEPRIEVGQLITIDSKVAKQFNGTFRVFGLNHKGTINDAEASQLTTTIQCNIGSQLFGAFNWEGNVI